MTEQSQKPFSMDYVVKTTVKHMRKSVDISIRKTFDRIAEFSDDQQKSQEIFKTLGILHNLRKQLHDFPDSNT